MKSTSHAIALAGLVAAAQATPLLNPCYGVGSNFTLSALYNQTSTPLHLQSYNEGGAFAGLSTSYPKSDTPTYLQLAGGNLLVTQSGAFGNETYQSTYIFNQTELRMFPQFQEVPENVDLSFVASGFKCLLAYQGIISEFGFCPQKDFEYHGKNTQDFLTYNITGGPNCFSALIEANEVFASIL